MNALEERFEIDMDLVVLQGVNCKVEETSVEIHPPGSKGQHSLHSTFSLLTSSTALPTRNDRAVNAATPSFSLSRSFFVLHLRCLASM
jgi:hypothetical protein